ncbi:uncharacterized protein BcabD6B2_35030 [Babesia caballi]|uniref:Uncharacterized protein n=1 Tax=Babesia caballi TaxID=5871 RepID=A0AAV4LWD4_BABCB|nr:hypothetical protein, conserved [Babesia caballi]
MEVQKDHLAHRVVRTDRQPDDRVRHERHPVGDTRGRVAAGAVRKPAHVSACGALQPDAAARNDADPAQRQLRPAYRVQHAGQVLPLRQQLPPGGTAPPHGHAVQHRLRHPGLLEARGYAAAADRGMDACAAGVPLHQFRAGRHRHSERHLRVEPHTGSRTELADTRHHAGVRNLRSAVPAPERVRPGRDDGLPRLHLYRNDRVLRPVCHFRLHALPEGHGNVAAAESGRSAVQQRDHDVRG